MSLIICPGFKLLKFLAGSFQAVEGLVVFWSAATEVSLIVVVTVAGRIKYQKCIEELVGVDINEGRLKWNG